MPNFDIHTTDAFEKVAGPEAYFFAPIVTKPELATYERYAWDHQEWIKDDLELRGLGKVDPGLIAQHVYPATKDGSREDYDNAKVHVPIWQLAPVPTDAEMILLDLYSHASFKRMIDDCTQVQRVLLSEIVDRNFIARSLTLDANAETDDEPRSYAIQPVFESFAWDSPLVGFVFVLIPWFSYLVDVLPPGTIGYVVEIQDSCTSSFFYQLDGPDVTFLHSFTPNPTHAHLSPVREFAEFARYTGETSSEIRQHCAYRIVVHPTDELYHSYKSNEPILYTTVVVAVFAVTVMVFVLYDYLVQKRQQRVMRTAQKTSAIVRSLFPKSVQTRLLQEMNDDTSKRSFTRRFSGKDRLKGFLGMDGVDDEDADENTVFLAKPIADFFPVSNTPTSTAQVYTIYMYVGTIL